MQDSAALPVSPRTDRLTWPLIAIALLVIAVGFANFADQAQLGFAMVVGPVALALMASRPEIGIYVLLSSLLVTYPGWLQGPAPFTLNNALGGLLGLLLVYRLYHERDWGAVNQRELILMLAIAVVFLGGRYANEPEQYLLDLVGPVIGAGDQDSARTLVSRVIFFVYFVAFIRTARHVRVVFWIAVALMVASGVAGIWYVLSGWGFAGYRARSGFFIGSAGNPNRLALFATIGILGLWEFLQHRGAMRGSWALPLLPALGLSVLMTGSRSGLVGMIFGIGLLFIDTRLTVQKIVVGVIAVLAAAMLTVRIAPEQSIERATASDSELGRGSFERRTYGIELALDLAKHNPITGVGIGNFAITRYLEDPTRVTTPPHSSYVLALVEGGVVVLGMYLVLLWWTFWNFVAADRAARSGRILPRDMAWMTSTLRLSFIVFAYSSLVGDLWLNVIFFWFIGIGCALRRILLEGEKTDPEGALVGATA